MARKKQAAPSRGGRGAHGGAGAGGPSRADDDDDVAEEEMHEEEEEEEAPPPRKRARRAAGRAAGDSDGAAAAAAAAPLLLPLLPRGAAASAGALCVGHIPLTWQAQAQAQEHASGHASGSGACAATDTRAAPPHTLILQCAADSDDDSEGEGEDAADAHVGSSTRCVALCDGAGAGGGACAVAAPRRVARALATLVRSGAAAASLSSSAASLRVWLTAGAFSDAPSAALDGCATRAHAAARTLLPWLLRSQHNDGISNGTSDAPSSGFDPAALYARLRRCHVSSSGAGGAGGVHPQLPQLALQVPGLRPRLRPYQARAAAWALARERDHPEAQRHNGGLHPLWQRVEALRADDSSEAEADAVAVAPPCFYFCALTGRLSRAPFPFPPLPRGGILADEMVRRGAARRRRRACTAQRALLFLRHF
jgi:hypothetical protein